MSSKRFWGLISAILIVAVAPSSGNSDSQLQKCSIPTGPPPCAPQERTSPSPTCGIELTCTDKPVQLGYSDGVCFRATCPGIWALRHKRVDQASFRRRFITYRHYSFVGYWQIKDQGVIETADIPLRELFVVLPDDLIEFKLQDPDCNTAVEVKNLGYIKRGSVDELKHWVAYNSYLERQIRNVRQENAPYQSGSDGPGGVPSGFLGSIFSFGRILGLPFCN